MNNFKQYLDQFFIESVEINEKIFSQLKKQFTGSKVYRVGGAVRDELLSKYHLSMKDLVNKDIDYLVSGVPMEELQEFLSKHGTVEKVGASFGVLKFWSSNQKKTEEPIDIAIPRTEKEKQGEKGHKATDVLASYDISPEEDLKRRDFTINMIAKDIEGKTLDPFGGEADIKNKILRMIKSSDDPNDPYHHFFIDPLRMIRGVQFVSRFDLTPDTEIKKWFKIKAEELKYISGERIQAELKKLFEKGNHPYKALKFAEETNLIPFMFTGTNDIDMDMAKKIENVPLKERNMEFTIAALLGKYSEKILKNVISGLMFSNLQESMIRFYHWIISENPDGEKIRKWMTTIKTSQEVPVDFDKAISQLNKIGVDTSELEQNKKYMYLTQSPRSFAISGKDLVVMGLQGTQIQTAQNKMKEFLIKNPDHNESETLLNVIKG